MVQFGRDREGSAFFAAFANPEKEAGEMADSSTYISG